MRTYLRPRGFTLIELLIVVAIIAILAAIAVPNFLEAQTRAKVSRVKSDHRTVATAMEAYRVDNNRLPAWVGSSPNGVWFAGSPNIFRQLTTPIAYISGESAFQDPFIKHRQGGDRYAWYALAMTHYFRSWGDYTRPNEPIRIKDWGIRSYGPDADDDGARNQSIVLYDPTNGTVSDGDIWRIDDKAELNGFYMRDRR